MKKVNVSFDINVCDDFYPGNCSGCPLLAIEEREVFYNQWTTKKYCSLGFSSVTCPIKETKNDKT